MAGFTRRRATVYVLVLGGALVVTAVGVSAVMSTRVRLRAWQDNQDAARARLYARSAVDLAIFTVESTPEWRDVLAHGVWANYAPLEDGLFTIRGLDPNDADLADSEGDPLVIIGTGRCGSAEYNLQVVMRQPVVPLDALETAVLSDGNIDIDWNETVTIDGAPLATNADLWNYGFLNSDIEVQGGGTYYAINGDVTVNGPEYEMPADEVFAAYQSVATPMTFQSTVEKVYIGPDYNPWGAANEHGLYFIDTGGNSMTIKGVRIVGTLVIDAHGGLVKIERGVHWRPARCDYPAMVVLGRVDLALQSDQDLTESEWSTNFNPATAASMAAGDTSRDSDTSDSYPCRICGLVDVDGRVTVTQISQIDGTLFARRSLSIENDLTVRYDPVILSSPPAYYFCYDDAIVEPGSWAQILPTRAEALVPTPVTPIPIPAPVMPITP